MRVLVLGSGAKDSAAAWWLSQSTLISELYIAPGNPGTADYAINLPDVDISNAQEVYRAVTKYSIEFVFIGTEEPLLSGVKEYLTERNIYCIGASQEVLRLEKDRSFSRSFSQRHSIPTPWSKTIKDIEELKNFLSTHSGIRYTIKSNTLLPSRIMINSSDSAELINFSKTLFKHGPILLEDYVEGLHATATLFVDGLDFLLLPLTNEYTNAYHAQQIPTGGMGAISPLPIKDEIKERIINKIIKPILEGMQAEGFSYSGILTLSIIIKKSGEPVLVDYHVRLNDPATQAMVPIINTDIMTIILAIKNKKLKGVKLSTNNLSTVAVVLASNGYPLEPQIGLEIGDLSNAFLMNYGKKPIVFLGAVKYSSDKGFVTDGGRCITVVGKGTTIEEANESAYSLINSQNFTNLYYRDDIGEKFFNQE